MEGKESEERTKGYAGKGVGFVCGRARGVKCDRSTSQNERQGMGYQKASRARLLHHRHVFTGPADLQGGERDSGEHDTSKGEVIRRKGHAGGRWER